MSTSILLYDGAMFKRRRAPKSEVQLWEIPEGTLDLLEILQVLKYLAELELTQVASYGIM
jgi:hypothetical protein